MFQLLGECHCWWTSESPRAHVAKFYGLLRLIRSVLRASKFSVLKLTEIVVLWVCCTCDKVVLFSVLTSHKIITEVSVRPFRSYVKLVSSTQCLRAEIYVTTNFFK